MTRSCRCWSAKQCKAKGQSDYEVGFSVSGEGMYVCTRYTYTGRITYMQCMLNRVRKAESLVHGLFSPKTQHPGPRPRKGPLEKIRTRSVIHSLKSPSLHKSLFRPLLCPLFAMSTVDVAPQSKTQATLPRLLGRYSAEQVQTRHLVYGVLVSPVPVRCPSPHPDSGSKTCFLIGFYSFLVA